MFISRGVYFCVDGGDGEGRRKRRRGMGEEKGRSTLDGSAEHKV